MDNIEKIDKYMLFSHSLKEGYGNSFHVMSRYLIYLSNILTKDNAIPDGYWEKRVEPLFRIFGKEKSIPIEDIVCTHDIYYHKLVPLLGETIYEPPTGILLNNGWFLIFDGHHRCAAQILGGANEVTMRYIEPPEGMTEEIVRKVYSEEST